MKILNNTRKPNGNTTYIWDNKFYCLAVEFFTSFNQYLKGLQVELTLALLSDFLKNVTFAIFEHEPKDIRLFTRLHLYTMLWITNLVYKKMTR